MREYICSNTLPILILGNITQPVWWLTNIRDASIHLHYCPSSDAQTLSSCCEYTLQLKIGFIYFLYTGQSQLFGPSQPFVARVGDGITLPCPSLGSKLEVSWWKKLITEKRFLTSGVLPCSHWSLASLMLHVSPKYWILNKILNKQIFQRLNIKVKSKLVKKLPNIPLTLED